MAHKFEIPGDLSESSRAQFDKMLTEGDYDAASYQLGITLWRAVDQRDEARKKILELGAVIKDRFGQPKRNPWCDVEVAANRAISDAYRRLGFDQEPKDGGGQKRLW